MANFRSGHSLAYLSLFIIVRRAKAKWPRPQGPVAWLSYVRLTICLLDTGTTLGGIILWSCRVTSEIPVNLQGWQQPAWLGHQVWGGCHPCQCPPGWYLSPGSGVTCSWLWHLVHNRALSIFTRFWAPSSLVGGTEHKAKGTVGWLCWWEISILSKAWLHYSIYTLLIYHGILVHTQNQKKNGYNITKHAYTISKNQKHFQTARTTFQTAGTAFPKMLLFFEMVCMCFHRSHAHHFESTQWPQRQWRNMSMILQWDHFPMRRTRYGMIFLP